MPPHTAASPVNSGGSDDARNSDQGEGGGGGSSGKPRKIPKLPMVRHNRKWFRCRTLKSTAARVQLEFGGFESTAAPFWLATDSDRIWRGSYKGKDWRHLVRSLQISSWLNTHSSRSWYVLVQDNLYIV